MALISRRQQLSCHQITVITSYIPDLNSGIRTVSEVKCQQKSSEIAAFLLIQMAETGRITQKHLSTNMFKIEQKYHE